MQISLIRRAFCLFAFLVFINSAHAAQESLWIGHMDGAVRIDSASGEILAAIPAAMPVDALQAEQGSGRVWLLSNNSLHCHAADGALVLDVSLPVNGSMLAQSMVLDEDRNTLWVADPQNLFRFSLDGEMTGSWSVAPENFIFGMALGANGELWLGGDTNVWRVADDNLALEFSSPDLAINGLSVDPADGDLWLVGGHGARRHDEDGALLEDIALPAGFIATRVMADSNGAWITGPYTAARVNGGNTPAVIITPFNDITSPWGYPANVTDIIDSLPPGHIWMSAANHVRLFAPDGSFSTDLIVPDAGMITRLATQRDTVAPAIRFDFPPEESAFNDPKPMIGISFEDAGSGVNTTSLRFTVNSQSTIFDCDTGEGFANCRPAENLPEGAQYLTVEIADNAGNVSAPAERNLVIDLTPPAAPAAQNISIQFENGIANISAPAGTVEPGTQVTITNARTDESVTVTAGLDGSFSAALPGMDGDTFVITIEDAAGNISDPVERETGMQLPPDPASIAPPIPDNIHTTFHDNIRFLYEHNPPVQRDVAAGAIDEERAVVMRGRVTDREGNPVPGVKVTVLDGAKFGYTLTRADGHYDIVANGGVSLVLDFERDGFLPVQRRFATPRASYHELADVVMIGLDPLATVVPMNQPEGIMAAGSPVIDEDGERTARVFFPPGTQANMVMPDGSRLSLPQLTFRATEYTVGVAGPDAMPGTLPPTSAYTYAVELSADEAIAAGAEQIEFSRPVAFYVDNFLGFPVGSLVPVGWYDRKSGAWVSSDNGVVIGVAEVEKEDSSEPTRYGLDLNGDAISNYDDEDWMQELEIGEQEVEELLASIQPGDSVWRASIAHFTPWDLNWFGKVNRYLRRAFGIGVESPDSPDIDSGDSSKCAGCIIEAETRIVREEVPLAGTPFKLSYRSEDQAGFDDNTVIFRTPETLPDYISPIGLSFLVNGHVIDKMEYQAGEEIEFKIPTHDPYGRAYVGTQPAKVTFHHEVDAEYFVATFLPQIASLFGNFPTADSIIPDTKLELRVVSVRSTSWTFYVEAWRSSISKIGNWRLSELHSYDPVTGYLHRGDGTTAKLIPAGNLVPYQVFDIPQDLPDERLPLWEAVGQPLDMVDMNTVRQIVSAPDGERFLIEEDRDDAYARTIYRVDDEGLLQAFAVAGNGNVEYIRELFFDPRGTMYAVLSFGDIWGLVRFNEDGTTHHFGDEYFDSDFEILRDSPEGRSVYDVLPREWSHYAVDSSGRFFFANYETIWVANNNGMISRFADIDVGNVQDIFIGRDDALYLIASDRIFRYGLDGLQDWAGLKTEEFEPDHEIDLQGLRDAMPMTDGSVVIHRAIVRDGQELNELLRISGEGVVTRLNDIEQQVGCTPDAIDRDGFITETCLTDIRLVGATPSGDIYLATESLITVKKTVAPDAEAVAAFKDPDRELVYQFDADGRHRATVEYFTGQTLHRFEYDEAGELSAVVDRFDARTLFLKVPNGWRVISPDGHETLLSMNDEKHITAITAPGKRWNFEYDSGGLLTGVTDPREHITSLEYDRFGRLIHDQWANGGGWTFEKAPYIGAGREGIEQTSGEGRVSRYDVYKGKIESFHDKIVITAPDGTTSVRYFSIDTVELPDRTSIHTQKYSDPHFGYQSFYNDEKTIQSGTRYLIARDRRGAILGGEAHPLGLSSWSMDSWTMDGNLDNDLSLTSSRVSYDTSDRIWQWMSGEGRLAEQHLDTRYLPQTLHRSGLATVDYVHDHRGRIERIGIGDGGTRRETAYAYHPPGSHQSGYLASVTDALGRNVAFEYDLAGRVQTQTLPDGRSIGYEYDANDNITAVIPSGRPAHRFSHTVMNQQGGYFPPDIELGEKSTNYVYNLDKQLELITRPDGRSIDFVYGAASGKLDRIFVPNGQYEFDYNATTGKLEMLTGPAGEQLTYTYDGMALDRVDISGTINHTVQYGYDALFRPISLAVGGYTSRNEYDRDSLLLKSSIDEAPSAVLTIERAALDGRILETRMGEIATAPAFNEFGELAGETATAAGSDTYAVTYERDKLGRITRKTETVEGITTTYDYTYDLAGQLDTVSENDVQVRDYDYDSNGNRTHINGELVGTYDDQDRLLSGEGCSYQYTGNGELDIRACGTETLDVDYDVLGNLRHAALHDGTRIDYVIDGQNRRIGKKVNGVLVQGFLYQNQLEPVAELDGNNNVVARFVYAEKPHVPSYMLKDGNTYRIISDHLGSVRLVIDTATGGIAQRMDYDVWGNVTLDTNPGFQPFGFAGGIYDRDTGLTRFGARDYDPMTGRWTAKDPIGFSAGDTNLYQYVGADPVNWLDRSGRSKTDKLYGLAKDFWNWYHRQIKRPGDPDLTKPEAHTLHQEWKSLGEPRPDRKGKWRQEGFVDPSILMELLVPFLLTPAELGCSDLDCDGDGEIDNEYRSYFDRASNCQ